MSTEQDRFRDLYLDIAGEEVLTDSQKESPSHEPIGRSEAELERTVMDATRHNGLSDAVAGTEKPDRSR